MKNGSYGPSKTYPHFNLTVVLDELGMGHHTFARLCGLTRTEMRKIMHRKLVPTRRVVEKETAVRTHLQELSGYLWEELFYDDFLEARNRLTKLLNENGSAAACAKSALQERGLISEDPLTPFDELVQKEESDAVLHKTLEEVLSTLDRRQVLILKMRFYEGLTCEECGRRLGMHRGGAHALEYKALRNLRHPTKARKLLAVCNICQL